MAVVAIPGSYKPAGVYAPTINLPPGRASSNIVPFSSPSRAAPNPATSNVPANNIVPVQRSFPVTPAPNAGAIGSIAPVSSSPAAIPNSNPFGGSRVTAPSGAWTAAGAGAAVGAAVGAATSIAQGAPVPQAIGTATGSAIGSIAGGLIGGTLGSAFGPIGTAVGGVAGSAIGGALGSAVGNAIANALSPTMSGSGSVVKALPVGLPSEGVRSEQLYTLFYKSAQVGEPPPNFEYAYGTDYGRNLAALYGFFTAQYGQSQYVISGVNFRATAPILSPGEAGPLVDPGIPQPQTLPVSLPTDINGAPITLPSLAPGQNPAPSAIPKPGTISNPSTKPSSPALPEQLPYTPPAQGPSPSPNPARSPSPTGSPSPTPTSSPQSLSEPTPQTRTRKGDCCEPSGSEQQDSDLLKKIAKAIGVDDFPASLPLLTGDVNESIENIPGMILWAVKNLDAIGGMFPAEVEIVGADGKKKQVKLESIGHALEEIFGALVVIGEDADAAVNIGARTAVEAIQSKISARQAGETATAIAKFMGFAGQGKKRDVKIGFTPAAAGADNKLQNQEMSAFLQPSTQSYVGYECVEKDELLPILKRILQDAEIARAALFHPLRKNPKGDEEGITGEHLRSQRGKPTKGEQKTWEKFKEQIKQTGAEIDDSDSRKKG